MKEIIAAQDGYLLADISHISGLVSAGLAPNPFDHSDVVMTTTHKTLGTVRNAIIFFRKGTRVNAKGKEEPYDLEQKINDSVFPGHFGGPHNHAIGGAAVGLKLVTHPLYKAYQADVANNAKVLCETLNAKGYPIVGNGTSNHLSIINVKEKGIDGARVDHFCSRMSISVNKNVIPGGQNAVIPGGLRLGTPAMTTRGCKAADFKEIARILDQAIVHAKTYKKEKQTLAQYKALVDESLPGDAKAQALRAEVEAFSKVFPFPYN